MILLYYSAYSIPDSLKNVSQSVLNYDTIIVECTAGYVADMLLFTSEISRSIIKITKYDTRELVL